jgi:phosphotransferase system  glucose/maltose/N-acetylglucosamine-specific IIC component
MNKLINFLYFFLEITFVVLIVALSFSGLVYLFISFVEGYFIDVPYFTNWGITFRDLRLSILGYFFAISIIYSLTDRK